MFSGYELVVIKSWAKEAKEILKGHLNSKIFTHEEKEDKRREYVALDMIMEKVGYIEENFADLDADHLGHLLWICEEYHKYLREQVETANMTTMDYANARSELGWMHGRAAVGLLTPDDVEIIESWESLVE